MSEQILLTKLFVPSPRVDLVLRHRLIERLNNSLVTGCKLTLISAPAGFGKSTLVCDWLRSINIPIAWLTLDERDKDPARFLAYLVAALQNVKPGIGLTLQAILQSPQPLQIENILTLLINEISIIEENFLIVLDDYHTIDSPQVDQLLDFLVEHQPAKMHLVITTREDPHLPLARLRSRGQSIELRAADLRFTKSETAEYLNRIMNLGLSEQEIDALETRTEGWIAGLQMAAISLEGSQDTQNFIQSFTGSHRFVMDYLLEEVLIRQPENIQAFLRKTSILDRMCGSLCDALLENASIPGQSILDYLDHANLFIIPQDNERCWFRYHHLFTNLLRKQLGQSLAPEEVNRLHNHASEWYENNDLILEAFRHAAVANEIERAVRLMESSKMPLHLRGTVSTILEWLMTLPGTVLNAQPVLWFKQAEMLLLSGQMSEVEGRLLACEAALGAAAMPGAGQDENTRDLIGRIAATRANLAQAQVQIDVVLAQARRALDYLHPDNLSSRSSATCALGYAYFWQQDWAGAEHAYIEALSLARATGDIRNNILASIRLGQLQKDQNQLYQATETYQHALQLLGETSDPNAVVAYFGLAEIFFAQNNIAAAEQYAQQGLQLAQQYDQIYDRIIMGELHLAIIKLAQRDVAEAAQSVARAEHISRQKNFDVRRPNIAFFQTWIYLHKGELDAAAQLASQNDIPLMRARVLIRQGNPAAALDVLDPLRQEAEAKGLAGRLLEVMAVQSVALYTNGDKEMAFDLLGKVLAQAEPEGIVRLFLDEGPQMNKFLSAAVEQGITSSFVKKLLAAFDVDRKDGRLSSIAPVSSSLVEPLSLRELEVLRLIAQGLSNQAIGERLFLALDTVKGHNRRIFEKLQVQRRTEAIARARELGLI